jgi:ubiquinone/menaquinone biosynthesis C-methylase UbiE
VNPWERFVVPNLIACACSSRPIMKQRAKTVPNATGEVLELGCGSGTNFTFYDAGKVSRLYALEPSAGMLVKARRAAAALPIGDKIAFLKAGAEAVPLEDSSIDTVVITFVLCTIPDWQGALREVARVLKPGGTVIYSEHGLSPDAGIARWQRRIEPIWKPIAGGCHLTRDTAAMLTSSGFVLGDDAAMYLPNSPKIAGYVRWGRAQLA